MLKYALYLDDVCLNFKRVTSMYEFKMWCSTPTHRVTSETSFRFVQDTVSCSCPI